MPRSYSYDNLPEFMRREERPPPPPAPRQAVSSRPEPEGVQILDNHRRVGDAQRNTYLEYLSDLHARGYLPAEEFEARKNAALNAEVEYDLNRLISDTPGLVEPNPGSVKRALRSPAALISWFTANKDSPVLAVIAFALWGMASVCWASVVPGLLGFYATPQSGFAISMVVFFIVSAVLSVIAEIVAIVAYVDA